MKDLYGLFPSADSQVEERAREKERDEKCQGVGKDTVKKRERERKTDREGSGDVK